MFVSYVHVADEPWLPLHLFVTLPTNHSWPQNSSVRRERLLTEEIFGQTSQKMLCMAIRFFPKVQYLAEVLDTNMFLSFLPIHRSDLGREQVTFPNMRLGKLTFPPQLTIAEINLEDDKTTPIPCISKNVCWVGHAMEIINDTAIVTHTGNVNVYLRFITFKQGTEEELQFTKSMFTSKSLLLWRKAFVTKTLCTSCLRRQVPCCLRAAQPRSIGKKAPQVTKEYVLTRSQQRKVADMMSIQDQDLRNNDLVDKHSWDRTQRCIIIDCSNGFKAVLGNRLQYFAICFSAAAHSVVSSNQLENGKLRLQELLSFSEADIPEMIHGGKVLYLFENEAWNLNNMNPSY